MLRRLVPLALALWFSSAGVFSCKRKAATPARQEPIAAPPAVETPEPPPGPPLSITATVGADGQIVVVGKDKWNQPLSFTYQDAWYFRNALDSLDRWVNEPELKMLRDLAATLPEVAPPPPLPAQEAAPTAPLRPARVRPAKTAAP